MTCSSNTIFTPERPHRAAGLWLAVAALALAPVGAGAQQGDDAATLIEKARSDIARGDGIAAEVRLKQALGRGAARKAVAAYLGEAYLTEGNNAEARRWLAPGQFESGTAAGGFHALARLEIAEGKLGAAASAFDRALTLAPDNSAIWVDVARMRYLSGEQVAAVDAADRALALDRRNVRALEFRGRIVRDQFGLVASLPWFEAALVVAPDDLAVLGEFAATLGELGRAREMLAVTRRMLALDEKNPRALYLQAVLAARAGNTSLARALLNRAGGRLDNVPGAMLLDAVLAIRAGNNVLAIDTLEHLLARQPGNQRARVLLARALFLDGKHRAVVERFAQWASQADAPPYLVALVGRAHEVLGDRQAAAAFLDRASRVSAYFVVPVAEGSPLGTLIAQGRLGEAQAGAEANRTARPGSAGFQVAAGDVQLARGNGRAALERYGAAARVRLDENTMLKMVAAHLQTGNRAAATQTVETFLARNPSSMEAAWQAGRMALARGDWARARMLLKHVERGGSGRDVSVLAELSLASLRAGKQHEAAAQSARAYALQQSSGAASAAYGVALANGGRDAPRARALLAKARRISGDSALLAEARRQLKVAAPG